MKKILLVLLLVSSSAFARLSWDQANLTDQKQLGTAGAETVFECSYQLATGGTYSFTIRYKGFSCPQSIVVNIESGKWKERR